MKAKVEVLVKSIIAGIYIAIAGSIYLTLYDTHKVLGAFLFSFALLLVVFHGLNLYTGKIGYVIDKKPSFLLDIVLMIIGNAVGIILISLILKMSNLTIITSKASELVTYKLDLSGWELLGRAILCGMLMYIGVEGSRRIENVVLKPLIVIFCVMIFILACFEHSIANIFYFTIGNAWSFKSLGYLLIMLLGNGVGAILLNAFEKLGNLKK